ncbi:hypothetical protein [Bacteroides heparinolyticus]|uniref:hypothetical protein n=1 Tax=Prevotella heparinolytica TaxID=28113 RepID=UPI0035A073F0
METENDKSLKLCYETPKIAILATSLKLSFLEVASKPSQLDASFGDTGTTTNDNFSGVEEQGEW